MNRPDQCPRCKSEHVFYIGPLNALPKAVQCIDCGKQWPFTFISLPASPETGPEVNR